MLATGPLGWDPVPSWNLELAASDIDPGTWLPDFPGRRWAAIVLNAAFLVPSAMFFRVSSVGEGVSALGRQPVWCRALFTGTARKKPD